MTSHAEVRLCTIGGTAAGLARTASGRTLIADRPEGRAKGQGLGFNGAELLAAPPGGCFWNDLHEAADAAGIPLRVVRGHLTAALSGAPEAALAEVFDAAREGSTIAASLSPAFPITFHRQGATA